jgi:hypothetical protein
MLTSVPPTPNGLVNTTTSATNVSLAWLAVGTNAGSFANYVIAVMSASGGLTNSSVYSNASLKAYIPGLTSGTKYNITLTTSQANYYSAAISIQVTTSKLANNLLMF